MLCSMFRRSLPTMDAEEVVFAAGPVQAVIDEVEAGRVLGRGADGIPRAIVVKFPAGVLSKLPKAGERFTARGQQWQIPAENDAVKSGQIAVEVRGEEPEKRRGS